MLWWSWMSQCQCHWTLVSFSLSITPCSMICLFVLADTISAVIIWLAFNGQNIVIKNLLQWDSLSTQHCPHRISYTGTGLLSMHLVKSCLSTRIIDAADGVGSGHIPLRHSPPGQFPSLLHFVEHSPLPSPPSAIYYVNHLPLTYSILIAVETVIIRNTG